MKISTRIILAVAALSLSATYFLPLWRISLDAPQYPEGLGLKIWINEITGEKPNDLNSINNLNHYIGMQKIKPDAIPELRVMPWVMRVLLLAGVAIAIFGRLRFLWVWVAAFSIVAIVGLVDFYMWGYDYGHNLDTENAAIKIPGMSYQPPLIGKKQLLNFTAYSYPGEGGWVAIAAYLVWLTIAVRHQMQRIRKRKTAVALKLAPATALIAAIAISCGGSREPSAIEFGRASCDYCKMSIVQPAFATAALNQHAKQFNFDSIECLLAFSVASADQAGPDKDFWFTTVDAPGKLHPLSQVTIAHSDSIRSPMGMGFAAYLRAESPEAQSLTSGADVLTFEQAQQLVKESWLK